jgi:hypothetical protein
MAHRQHEQGFGRNTLSHAFSREFETAGRSFDLRRGRFEFRWALTEPAIHNVPTALHTEAEVRTAEHDWCE